MVWVGLQAQHPIAHAQSATSQGCQAAYRYDAFGRTILNAFPYKKVARDKVKLPQRFMKGAYDDQATLKGRKFVPERF